MILSTQSSDTDFRCMKRKRKVDQDREPNFRVRGKLYLVQCYSCDRENYAPAVSSGICVWCGWCENNKILGGGDEQ